MLGGTDTQLRTALALFGAAIRRRREAAGIPPTACAFAAGIAPNELERVESGSREPELTEMQGIARALGVPLSELLRDAEQASG